MKKPISAAILVLVSAAAVPAQAESADDIYGYFDVLWSEAVPPADSCESSQRMNAACGLVADKLVCAANAIYVAIEEAGMADRFPRQISGLNRLLSEKANYFNNLIIEGYMKNPADMDAFDMRDFCRDIGAQLVP